MPTTKYLKGSCQSCGGRLEFPAEAVGTNIECPHCGESTELMLKLPPDEPTIPRSTLAWTGVTTLVLLLGLGAGLGVLKRAENQAAAKRAASVTTAQSQASASAPEESTPEAIVKDEFRCSTVTLQKSPGSSLVYAVGTLTNTSARQRFGVKVLLDLIDETGKKVGEASDYQGIIEPRTEWRFKALAVAPKTASATVASVSEDK